MILTTRFVIARLMILSVAFLFLGCSGEPDSAGPSKNATVTGKVTSGGQPLSNAIISFEKPGLGAWGGEVGADGTYSVELAAGEFNVSVSPKAATTTSMEPGNVPEAAERSEIPQKYRSASTSGLTTTINEGDNTFDVELSE